MEPLNQSEWFISFTIINRAIVEALFQIYQNTDTQAERANQDNENHLQRGLYSNEEMPYDVSHRELTNFQPQTESDQESTSLKLYQNESDDGISFKLSREFQIYQTTDTQTERANLDNENPLQHGLHSSEEIPYDVSHRELTNFQIQTESNQQNTSLNLYQTECDDGISFKLSHKNYLYDDDQACAPNLDTPGYVYGVHTTNGVQSDVPDMEQPNFLNIQNSKSNPIHIPNRNIEESNSSKLCKKYFKCNSQINRYMLKHSGEKSFVCNICPKRFTQKFNLNKHMLIHSGTKTFICNVCGQPFTQNGNLKRHMLQHSGEKPFLCHLCEKRFIQKIDLNRHMLTHSGEKPFQCHLCEKRYFQKCQLNRHMLIHSGTKAFKCNICEKRFTQKSTLGGHMSTHSDEKPFKCDICNKQFARKDHAKIHTLIHYAEKPHNCHICDRGFTQKSNLNKHILTHEKNVQKNFY